MGAGQSGTLGFFRPGVVNLDGKLNLEAYRNSGRVAEYLEQKGLAWIVDWSYYIEGFLGPDPTARGWIEVGERGGFHLYHRIVEKSAERRQPPWVDQAADRALTRWRSGR